MRSCFQALILLVLRFGRVTGAVGKVGPHSGIRQRKFKVKRLGVGCCYKRWRTVTNEALTPRRRIERQRRTFVLCREQTLERLPCGLLTPDAHCLAARYEDQYTKSSIQKRAKSIVLIEREHSQSNCSRIHCPSKYFLPQQMPTPQTARGVALAVLQSRRASSASRRSPEGALEYTSIINSEADTVIERPVWICAARQRAAGSRHEGRTRTDALNGALEQRERVGDTREPDLVEVARTQLRDQEVLDEPMCALLALRRLDSKWPKSIQSASYSAYSNN